MKWHHSDYFSVSEVLGQLPLRDFPLRFDISVFDVEPGWCETVYLYRPGVARHQWRAVPMQSWMDNGGSCTVPGSCPWKECHAAGITDRSCSHEGLLFWWDRSTVLTKARKDVLVSSRSPGTYNTKYTARFYGQWHIRRFCAVLEDIKIFNSPFGYLWFLTMIKVSLLSYGRLVRLSLTWLQRHVKESDY